MAKTERKDEHQEESLQKNQRDESGKNTVQLIIDGRGEAIESSEPSRRRTGVDAHVEADVELRGRRQ